jgi:dTDP-4-amino-4,6-dideoxygalactose transaminase
MKVPFVDLQAQHQPIYEEVMEAVGRVISGAHFVLGQDVADLETEYAAYCGTQYAIGVDSGLSALKIALEAYGVGPGDEVIVPANTFIATAAAVTFVGAKPVLVDMDPDTHNIDITQIEAHITPRTKAILPVHLYGLPVDMDKIMEIANRRNLIVIEDACQAHGAYFKGRRAGSMGHAAAFSFYPAKNLGACGDAGILVTNDAKITEKAKALRNCGSLQKYYHITSPYNHRLDTLQAAILRIKLKHIDSWNAERRKHATLLNELLQGTGVVTPNAIEGAEPVWHLYVIRTARRDELQAFLGKQGIGTGIHYPIPIHLQPFYENLGYKKGDFPVTERYAEQILSLPMFPELTREAVEYIANTIKSFTGEHTLEQAAVERRSV